MDTGTRAGAVRTDSERGAVRTDSVRHTGIVRRLATETKQAFKTTELWAFLAILTGLFIAGIIADADEGSQVDGFGADKVWLYAVILTGAYLISRGLAKSGSSDPYSETRNGSDGSRH
jgi:hypothetical protein